MTTLRPRRQRSICWIALGALSVACAAGAFGGGPPLAAIEAVTATQGATTIGGVVYDSQTEQPVESALLVLKCDCLQGDRETQTNANGVFSFLELPAGTYAVRVLYRNADMTKSVPLRVDQTVRLRFMVLDEPHVVT